MAGHIILAQPRPRPVLQMSERGRAPAYGGAAYLARSRTVMNGERCRYA